MTETILKAGYYQFKPEFGKPQRNLSQIIGAIKKATADLIVLPELPFTGYLFNDREELKNLAQAIDNSAIVETLTDLCKDKNFHIVTGFAERDKDRLFNSALLIGPQRVLQVYRKLHLFYNEENIFDPGDRPFAVTQVGPAKVGMMICFDYMFPEAARSLALQGADLIAHPSNLVLDYCQPAMLTRCLENNIFAITANRCGTDKRPQGELTFTGKSQIAGPKGTLIHHAPESGAELFIAEIDLDLARDKMVTEYNHVLDDRRPEYY